MLMEGDPFALIEGMAIAAEAVGAQQGYIYLRSEYPDAIRKLNAALELCADIIAPFRCEVRVGAGAYVCGEETSLLNSLEGKRGEVRAKPPLPALEGFLGKPTVVNNVLSLAAVPHVLTEGGASAYQNIGFGRSRGTMPIQLAGNIRYGGLYEIGFGVTLGQLVNEIGGGTASGRPVKAVQVGGPLGAYLHPDQFDIVFDYETYTAADALIGHGGITVFDDTADMGAMARFAMEFCAAESCGKCTPCRIGAVRGVEIIDRIRAGGRSRDGVEALPQMHNAPKDNGRAGGGGNRPADRPVRNDEVRLALRAGRIHAVPGDERAEELAGGFYPVSRVGVSSPLPFRGGAGGGVCPPSPCLLNFDIPHPNPSPEGEGLK